MITKDIRLWLDRVKRGEYSYDDAMYEFKKAASYLTIDEMKFIKIQLEKNCNN